MFLLAEKSTRFWLFRDQSFTSAEFLLILFSLHAVARSEEFLFSFLDGVCCLEYIYLAKFYECKAGYKEE